MPFFVRLRQRFTKTTPAIVMAAITLTMLRTPNRICHGFVLGIVDDQMLRVQQNIGQGGKYLLMVEGAGGLQAKSTSAIKPASQNIYFCFERSGFTTFSADSCGLWRYPTKLKDRLILFCLVPGYAYFRCTGVCLCAVRLTKGQKLTKKARVSARKIVRNIFRVGAVNHREDVGLGAQRELGQGLPHALRDIACRPHLG